MKTRAPQITRPARGRRTVIEVITTEDLDLYILAVAAFACTIFGAFEIASVGELASSILALLAVLATSQIRSRRQLSNIERVRQAAPLAILAAGLPAGFVERRSEAATLFLAAISLCGPSGPAALADLRRVLRRGGSAQVLLLDPGDAGALAAVSQGDARSAGPARLGCGIQATLDELTDLGNEPRGCSSPAWLATPSSSLTTPSSRNCCARAARCGSFSSTLTRRPLPRQPAGTTRKGPRTGSSSAYVRPCGC
jgi:hypothetical protein